MKEMTMRKPIEVKEDVLKAAMANVKDAANRGEALQQITNEYVANAGRKVCLMWVRKRLIDLNLLNSIVRSPRGRKSK